LNIGGPAPSARCASAIQLEATVILKIPLAPLKRPSLPLPGHFGRDYERYVGYLHERDGFSVEYLGIACGYDDLGVI
jgi:hypothetical protein